MTDTSKVSLHLPPAAYLDPQVFAAEQRLFRSEWICVGRETDFVDHAYLALTIGDQPIVIWRDRRGTLRVFENVCRHRMSVIAEGRGTATFLTCPFHGWTYADDGTLRGAPQARDVIKGFDLKLPEYRLECWLGFVLINLDINAAPLMPRLAEVESMLEPYAIESFEFSMSDLAPPTSANWKLMLEIGLESYHFRYVHRETLARNLRGAPNPPPGTGAWTVSVEPRVRPLAAQDDDPAALTDSHRATTYTFGIFPGTVFNIDVDNLVWFTLLPGTTDQTATLFGSAARRAPLVRILGEDQPTTTDHYLEWGARLGGEDNAASARVQAGLRAQGARPGPVVPDAENSLLELQRYLRERIPDYPTAPAADRSRSDGA